MKAASLLRLRVMGVIFGFISLVGAYDYIMILTNNNGYYEYLGYGDRQIAYFSNYPIMLMILLTLGVWGAVFGSILFLCRSRWTVPAFGIAFLSQMILDVYTFLLRSRWEVLGSRLSIQDIFILFLTLGMLLYVLSLNKKGDIY